MTDPEPKERAVVTGKPGKAQILEQMYTSGTEGRSTTVRLGCSSTMNQIQKATESPRHHYNVYFGSPLLCAPGDISTLLEPLHGQCLRKGEGWWTHELCFGHRVRQYHKGKDGAMEQEHIVGKFNKKVSTKLEKGGKAVQQHMLVEAGGEEEMVYMFAQEYTDGARCDETKKPRSVTVRECVCIFCAFWYVRACILVLGACV